MKHKIIALFIVIVLLGMSGFVYDHYTSSGYLTRVEEYPLLLNDAPPEPNSLERELDDKIYLQTRSMRDTERWVLAQQDANSELEYVLSRFSVAIGHTFPQERYPQLYAFFTTIEYDVSRLVSRAKEKYQQKRPFTRQTAILCAAAPTSYDYPSGHSTQIWVMAYILSDLFPEHRAALTNIANDYAQSRVICGVHSLSAVQAGQLYAYSIYRRLIKEDDYQADYKKVQSEILQR